MKKYELTNETKLVDGDKLVRIRAIKNFSDVKAGDFGGWVSKEDNLSQESDCWIYDNAMAFGNARVEGRAKLYNDSKLYGSARISGEAKLKDSASVSDSSTISDMADINTNASITGNVKVGGKAIITDDVVLFGRASISGKSVISDSVKLFGSCNIVNSTIKDTAQVYDTAQVINSTIQSNSEIFAETEIKDNGAVPPGAQVAESKEEGQERVADEIDEQTTELSKKFDELIEYLRKNQPKKMGGSSNVVSIRENISALATPVVQNPPPP